MQTCPLLLLPPAPSRKKKSWIQACPVQRKASCGKGWLPGDQTLTSSYQQQKLLSRQDRWGVGRERSHIQPPRACRKGKKNPKEARDGQKQLPSSPHAARQTDATFPCSAAMSRGRRPPESPTPTHGFLETTEEEESPLRWASGSPPLCPGPTHVIRCSIIPWRQRQRLLCLW